jgi:hypothetical protein
MITILLIILILMLIGAFPRWPYSRGWGYYPSGGLGLILLIIVVLMLLQRVLKARAGVQVVTGAGDRDRTGDIQLGKLTYLEGNP